MPDVTWASEAKASAKAKSRKAICEELSLVLIQARVFRVTWLNVPFEIYDIRTFARY